MNGILNRVYFGNTLLDFLIFAGIVFLSYLTIKIFKYFILQHLKKLAERTERKIDEHIVSAFEKFLLPLLYFLVIYFGISYLKVQPNVQRIIDSTIIVISTYFAIRLIASLINYIILFYWETKSGNGERATSLKGLSNFISLVIWILGAIFLLDNLGFNISAIIAGLGIGGIAIALAAQAVLGDLFSYFVIFFDKPFLIGDFISVDDQKGTVEKIGIKTTRITSLSGEEIIFPNADLTKARIHNYKKLQRRRTVFNIQVVYDTSLENLKEIPLIIKAIIKSFDSATFDRSHFVSYGVEGLNFETVYYVENPDYACYMDIQQGINLQIFEEFEKRGIVFAFPTQKFYISKE